MSRYSSFCAFLILFALLENIVAAPKPDPEEPSSSGGEGSGKESVSGLKKFGAKAREGLSSVGVGTGLSMIVSRENSFKIIVREATRYEIIFKNNNSIIFVFS